MGYRSMLLVRDAVYLDLFEGQLAHWERTIELVQKPTHHPQDSSRTYRRAEPSISDVNSQLSPIVSAYFWIRLNVRLLVLCSWWDVGHDCLMPESYRAWRKQSSVDKRDIYM